MASSRLDEAVNYVRHLVKNRRKPYPIAIDMAAKEFGIGTKEISHQLNPPKREIKWTKPNLRDELGEYFENQDTKTYLFKKGYQFTSDEELLDFLSRGKMKELSRFQLAGMDNITTNPDDFQKELKEEGYADSYNLMRKELQSKTKITLPAPILLKIGNRYYGFAGNRRMNLAWSNNLPVKFWIVDTPDMSPTQKSLF